MASQDANPIVVEVTRGGHVECQHRGAIAVADAAGNVVAQCGDIVDAAVYPRSALKAVQALPFLETGTADRFGYDAADIALACASHSGAPGHVARAEAMLARVKLTPGALACGVGEPLGATEAVALHRAGNPPSALTNCCSGKHAAMLATAVHLGEPTDGYELLEHPVQHRVAAAVADVFKVETDALPCGLDGCALPNWAIPLDRLAIGFARLATGSGLSRERAAAAQRIVAAKMAHPWEVAGDGRFCTRSMVAAPGEVFLKFGADGVFTGGIPSLGLGFALKVDDGATRAVEMMMAQVLDALLPAHAKDLAPLLSRPVRNRPGAKVGTVRPAAALVELAEALKVRGA